jgi:hypothetical protein
LKRKLTPPAAIEACPTPDKALYRSAGEARTAALLARREKPLMAFKVYGCRCGFWHLASDWESG